MPVEVRSSEGLGVVVAAQNLKDMRYALLDGNAWQFVYCVAAPAVPPDHLPVNALDVRERVVALSVGSVDRLPRRKDEHRFVKQELAELGREFCLR